MNTQYKICTEEKNIDLILNEVSAMFSCFKISRGIGYWKGNEEQALTIEIVASDSFHDAALVRALAHSIRLLNNQESVLIIATPCQASFVS